MPQSHWSVARHYNEMNVTAGQHMFSFFGVGKYLPKFMRKPLFGDDAWRDRVVDDKDPDWAKWCEQYTNLYEGYYRNPVYTAVNEGGYRILRHPLVKGGICLEIGPGTMPHLDFWKTRPQRLDVVDIRQEFLDKSLAILHARGIQSSGVLADGTRLPFSDHSYDVIVSFYSMEHLLDLEERLAEFKRVLKPGGILVGGIPTEGGLAWGLGRWLTSRRKNRRDIVIVDENGRRRTFDFDKVIAMEHRNSVFKVIRVCDKLFIRKHVSLWPFHIPFADMNLTARFIYANDKA